MSSSLLCEYGSHNSLQMSSSRYLTVVTLDSHPVMIMTMLKFGMMMMTIKANEGDDDDER